MAKYITPAVTPLNPDGTPDIPGMENHYENLIRNGMDGILVLGSIGEFFALPLDVKKTLIREAGRIVDHRVRLMAGISAMHMDEAAELAQCAAEAGADCVIAVPPYYFSLGQAEIEAWYTEMARRSPLPLYLYNFPDRTGYSIAPETVLRLARKCPNIAGIKDTVPGVDHTREIVKLVKKEFPAFEVFSGFDDNFAHNVLSGGNGCIAGLSNPAPEVCSAWARAVNRGDWAESARFQQKIDRMMDIYSVGSPFVPFIKEAMILRGAKISPCCTFPLPAAEASQIEKLRGILKANDLL